MFHSLKHTLIAALAIGLVISFSDSDAAAEKRLVMLKIKGDRNSRIGKSLRRMLDNEHKILDGSTYELAAEKMDATRLIPRNIRKVASKIEADGVLAGRLRRRRGRYELKLLVLEGRSGKAIKVLTVRLRRRRLSRRMRRAIVKRLLGAIDELAIVENADSAIKEEDGVGKSMRKSDAMKDDEIGEDTVSDDKADKADKDDSPSVEKSATAPAKKPSDALWVAAGMSVVNRKLSFTVNPDLAEPPAGYSGPMAPGVYIEAEAFPLAMDGKRKDALANLGFGFTLDKVMSIKTILADPNGGMNVNLPTVQTQWGASVKYRYKVNAKATVLFRVGYNRSRFTVDRSGLEMGQVLDLPNTNYTYYDPGLTVRYKTSPKLTLEADARGLLITNAGEIQTPEQYGSAKVTGFEGGAVIRYKVKPRIVLNIGARYTAIGYDFNGDGTQTNARDNDPNTKDVGGALDTYLRGQVSLGYLF